jgi:hypothetical protein
VRHRWLREKSQETANPADATSTYEIRHLNERAGLLL